MEKFENCKCNLKEVALRTISFGKIKIPFSIIDVDELKIRVSGIGIIHLAAAIESDINGFRKLNKSEDEDHQVDISTLQVREIDIVESADPIIRIRYTFQHRPTDKYGRYCAGQNHNLSKMDKRSPLYVPDENVYFPLGIYSSGNVVYW